MIVRTLLFGFLVCAIGHSQEVPRAVQIVEPPATRKLAGQDRVISSTRQFSILGGAAEDRGNVSRLAEEAKDELLRLTEERDEWKAPVTVILHGKYGDPMPPRTTSMELFVSEVGFELRVNLHLSRGIDDPERLKHTVTSALVLERSLRALPARESEIRFSVPPWLVDGLREASAWRLNQSDRRLYEALFKTGGLFKTEEIFSLEEERYLELDAATAAAFRVSSGALVMALLQQPQGKAGFRAFLSEVAGFQGEMPSLLRRHFPELNLSESSLAKWWALQLANIGGQNLLSDVLTIAQTETALRDALRLNFRTPEGIIEQKELAAWPELAALPDGERIKSVRLAQDALIRLSYRCFPSYRPLLAEYQILLTAMVSGKTQDLPARLTALEERRELMGAKALRARDYLDWFEITRARETSGVFDDYIRLKERLKHRPQRREDHVSTYLDRMDAIFHRPDDKNPGGMPSVSISPWLPER
jgi:hypothetical protein